MELPRHGEIPWNDFRSTAAWRGQVLSPEELCANSKHKLFEVEGINPLSIHLDTLHCLDLGVSAHVAGNVLWCVLEAMPMNRDAAMEKLNVEIQAIYTEMNMPAQKRLGTIKWKDLAASGNKYPCLKHVKGRRVRHFVPVLLELCRRYESDEPNTQHMERLVQALDAVYDLMDTEGFTWPTAKTDVFGQNVDRLLRHYGWLADRAFKAGLCRWSVVQKHHMLAHLPSLCKYIAPRHVWTYGSESYMGLMAGLAASSLNGTPAYKVAGTMMLKCRMFWHLVLRRLVVLD
jgi:hypothetical protein